MPRASGPQPSLGHLELLERLAASGSLEECQLLPSPDSSGWGKNRAVEVALSGRMTFEGHAVRLRVGLSRFFPLCLPEVAVERVEPPLELPHVSEDGKLCFEPEADLLLDRHDAWGVLQESLVLVRQMLHRMLTGSRSEEFARESIAYWRGLARNRRIDCIVSPDEQPHRTKALFANGKLYAVADEPRIHERSLPQRKVEALTQRNALYIPIDPAAADPAFHPRELTTIEGLRKYVRALPAETRRTLDRLLEDCDKHEEFVVLGVRRPDDERALLGVNLYSDGSAHPLHHGRIEVRVEPIELRRRDVAFLAPRGGAYADLQSRRVLIAGCGAVGGHLAFALARAGVGGLSLVDPDSFELANTYRHVCGMAWDGFAKVEGLKQELERRVPFISVTSHQTRIEKLLSESPEVIREHDLVISALGHPTVEMHLNEWLWSSAEHPLALFTWLEPLGLGGHVLLTHVCEEQAPTGGCLECLYERSTVGGPPENRAAFAMQGVTYTRDVLGCGSQHLPFADLDAQRTAEMASRLALRVLHGEVTRSTLLSWKGDSQAFERAKYTVTPRYLSEPNSPGGAPPSHVRLGCPVCQK